MLFFCGSTQVAAERIPEDADRETVVRSLCAALSCEIDAVRIEKDVSGAPRLVGKGSFPAVSFSTSGSHQWAAVAWVDGLGVDMACPREFDPPYPVARVFGQSEIRMAKKVGVEGTSGYALLWSLKEAVVKALGTGFNGVDPGELTAVGLRVTEQGIEAEVRVAEIQLHVLAIPVDSCWLAFSICKG